MKKLVLGFLGILLMVLGTEATATSDYQPVNLMPQGENDGIVCFRKFNLSNSYMQELFGEPWELRPVLILEINHLTLSLTEKEKLKLYIIRKGRTLRIDGILCNVYQNSVDENDMILLPKLDEGERYSILMRFYRVFIDSKEMYKYNCTM